MTVANQITIFRILLIPVFVGLVIYYGKSVALGAANESLRWWAVAVFVLAAASDGIDGFIARRFNQKSRLGVVLDPLADKGLLLAAIFSLAFSHWQPELPVWFALLVVARDIAIVAGVILMHYLVGKLEVAPTIAGKATTALQMIVISWSLIGLDPRGLLVLVCLAAVATLWSGIQYLMAGIQLYQTHAHLHE